MNTLVTEAEKDMENLISWKCLMEQDKINIETTIAILEKLKIDHLEKAFKIVNIHMAGIFSQLMNGTAEARLEKINKASIFEGFELKVKFSNGQDTNLQGLSGGQRSLLALSYLLALLRLKPAPFYILDEIDSALDLAHT